MSQTYTLTMEEYEALAARARRAQQTPDELRALSEFLRLIESKNGKSRFEMWVLWQEVDHDLPANTPFPTKWPPELKTRVEVLNRPVGKADVDAALRAHAKKPVTIMVTSDPGGEVGFDRYETVFRGNYGG